jgi:hypothetical protein
VLVNGERIAEVELAQGEAQEFYTRDFELPAAWYRAAASWVKFGKLVDDGWFVRCR